MPDHLGDTQATLKGPFGAILVGQSETGKWCHKPRGYEAKAQIDDGIYRPRDQLPSTRAVAAAFRASRITITAAYEQLLAEGFIETRRDAGPLFRLRFDRGACHGAAASRRQEWLVYRRSGDGSSSCPDRRPRPRPADRLSLRRYCSCPFPEPGLAARSDESSDGARSAQPALSGPPPRQCTEATIALPHQAPCCSKTFPVTRGKLGAARGLWSRIIIAFSCPASEHVSWHNLC